MPKGRHVYYFTVNNEEHRHSVNYLHCSFKLTTRNFVILIMLIFVVCQCLSIPAYLLHFQRFQPQISRILNTCYTKPHSKPSSFLVISCTLIYSFYFISIAHINSILNFLPFYAFYSGTILHCMLALQKHSK